MIKIPVNWTTYHHLYCTPKEREFLNSDAIRSLSFINRKIAYAKFLEDNVDYTFDHLDDEYLQMAKHHPESIIKVWIPVSKGEPYYVYCRYDPKYDEICAIYIEEVDDSKLWTICNWSGEREEIEYLVSSEYNYIDTTCY